MPPRMKKTLKVTRKGIAKPRAVGASHLGEKLATKYSADDMNK
jgi:hypothetical protein